MKKLLLAWLSLIAAIVNSQVSSYTFSQSTDAFASIAAGGSLVAGSEASVTTTNDGAGWSVTIPFNFNFNGTDFTSIYVNSNGGATFGTTSTSSTVISTTTNYTGAVGVMNRDLWGIFVTAGVTTQGSNVITNVASFKGIELGKELFAISGIPAGATITSFDEAAGTITMSANATSGSATAVIRYGTGKVFTSTIGAAPNRVFVIEWLGYNDYSTATSGSNYLNFQLRLAEGSNRISVVYGPTYNISTTTRTNQIGLRGASSTDFNNRTGTATTTWDSTTAGTTNSSTVSRNNTNFPASGQAFTWTPPTCLALSGLAASNITPNSATISWNAPATAPAGGYEYYYSTTNTAPTAGTAVSGVSATASAPLSGLSPVTTYYVWVRAICSATDVSAWSSMATFTTPCAANVPYYTNDFATVPGACWSLADGGTPASGPTGTVAKWFADGFLNNGFTGAVKINLVGINKIGWLISPVFDLSAGGYQMKFNYGLTTSGNTTPSAMGSDDVIHVLMSVDNGASWTVIQTWNAANAPDNTTNTFIYPVASTSNQVKFALYGTDGTVDNTESYDFFVDNFTVETVSVCAEPTNLSVGNITSSGAMISWAAPAAAPAGGYEYYYSTTNTAPVAGTVASGASTTLDATLSGLASNTTYYVWVRSVCSPAQKSPWTAVATFTTQCASYVPAYTNDFATFPGACWSQASGGTPAAGSTGTTAYWSNDGFLNFNNTTTGAAKINLFSNSKVGWLISPTFDLSAGGYRVKFNYGLTEYGDTLASAMGSDDVINVLMSVDNGASWTVIQTWTAANAPDNTSNSFVYHIPSNSGQVKFALYGSDGTTNDPEDYDFFVDNFVVEAIPSCLEPTALSSSNITGNGATISWTAPTTTVSNGYEVYYSTSTMAPTATTVLDATNSITSATTSVTISGLSPITVYYVWVRSVCTATSRSEWTPVAISFRTLCQPPVILSTTGDSFCPGSTATLSATAEAGATLTWYDSATGGTALATGNSFTTPNLNATTTYYVSAKSDNGVDTVGPVNPSALSSISAANYDNFYQIFNVASATTLKTVDVFPTSTAAIGTASAIDIRDNTGTLLVSVPYTVTVNDGVTPQTVVINYPLAVGTGYRISQGAGVAISLNRNDGGASYPYISSNITVVDNNFDSEYWYFFYNWQFSIPCESAREAVTATADPAACLGTSESTDENNNVKVYPNPFADVLNISDITNVKSISVIDVSGKLVKTFAKAEAVLNLNGLTSGMYLVVLNMKDGSKQTVKVIKK